jgi:hypothetical protein
MREEEAQRFARCIENRWHYAAEVATDGYDNCLRTRYVIDIYPPGRTLSWRVNSVREFIAWENEREAERR